MDKLKGTILTDRSVVHVGGAQAQDFFQGLITADMAELAQGQACLAALLTPQGKILFDFLVLHTGDGFLVDCRADVRAELVKRLGFYKLRAKVDITDMSETQTVVALWGAESVAIDKDFYGDPRHDALGWRAIVARGEADERLAKAGAEMVTLSDYHGHRIGLGIPEGGLDFALGDTFPHEADMDALGGVSFTKGCFIGQEVVSRMEHRGTTRSRIVPVQIDGTSPGPGTEIRAGGKTVGTIGSVHGARGLALMRLDRVEAARSAGEPIMAGEAVLTPLVPDWLAPKPAADGAS